MDRLAESVDQLATSTGFSGVVRVDRRDDRARSRRRPGITVDTQFGAASGAKGFTALVVLSLVERGELSLSRRAREAPTSR